MGQLGRRSIGGKHTTLLKELTRAYADEWFAHYNYTLVANTVAGPASPGVICVVRRKAHQAFDRANRLAGRINELGGVPIPKLTDLIHHATDKPFKLPENIRDLDGALKAVLDAERTGLRTYRALCDLTRDLDPISHVLAVECLAEMVQGEEQIERLLGEPAPDMDGR